MTIARKLDLLFVGSLVAIVLAVVLINRATVRDKIQDLNHHNLTDAVKLATRFNKRVKIGKTGFVFVVDGKVTDLTMLVG